MNDKFLRLLICLAAALLLALPVSSMRADDTPSDKNEKQAPKDKAPPAQKDADGAEDKQGADDGQQNEEEAENERPRRRGRRMRYDRRNEKNHSSVLAAFGDVVRDARKSTVAVLVDGQQKALGAIVDSGGYILTKFSEIEGAELKCRLFDGRRLPAELVDSDASNDLAMLKVEAENLVPLAWSEDSQPAVGQWLATTSFDSLPAAVGVVSVAPRKIDRPGGLLGVVLEDGDDGPLVVRVLANSAAEKSRVFVNDVIKQLNGKAVRNRQMLINMLRRMKAGTGIKLTIARADVEQEIEATLGARNSMQDTLGSELSSRRGGFASALQHDTVLDANQCGGPVVGLDGRAVGLNIARAGRVVSYALPADTVLSVIVDLLPKVDVEEKTSLTSPKDGE